MVKIGVIGNGECINSKIEQFITIKDVKLSGIFFTDNYSIKKNKELHYSSLEELIEHSDAIYIFETDTSPFQIVLDAFRLGKHVFIEHIALLTVNEIEQLLNSRKEANVKCIIGSLELSNPAYLAIKKDKINPFYIESKRSILYDRNNTKNIVLDLMLKDLAVILSIVQSDIKRIWANGFKVMSNEIDLTNARLEFSNGCVAVLSVSKCTEKQEAVITFYEENKIVNIDFETTKTFITTIAKKGDKNLHKVPVNVGDMNSFIYQLNNFKNCITIDELPLLKLREGYEKLDVAHKILKKINSFTEE